MTIVYLPSNLNIKTIGTVHRSFSNAFRSGQRELTLNFSNLKFADTCGMTALGTIISGFYDAGATVLLDGLETQSDAVNYMHDCQFFNSISNYKYNRELIRPSVVMPYTVFDGTNHVNFIHFKLRPWVEQQISLSSDSLETLCVCISEAFQNVEHHGGAIGFGMAQHYPKKQELHITVSDRGRGIPAHVRQIHQTMSDTNTLLKAIERGFTTKNNYTNRGFGLDNLIRYTVNKNSGSVMIRSLTASLFANSLRTTVLPAITTQQENWSFPGTLVHICLRTDTLERFDDLQPEEFKW